MYKNLSTDTIRPYSRTIKDYKGKGPTSSSNIIPGDGKLAAPVSMDWGAMGSKVVAAGKSLLPYASNILNAFRKVPQPQAPTLTGPASNYNKIDLSNAKNDIKLQERSLNRSSDANLDSQTAAAVKAGTFAQGAKATSEVAESEANANAQQGNRVNELNTQINMQNNALVNQYHDRQTEAQVAQQRESSQNIANAADKYITGQNVDAQYDLDLKKFDVLKNMYSGSGVTDRLVKRVLGKGAEDELKPEDYKSAITVAHRFGGPLLTLPMMRGKIKKTY